MRAKGLIAALPSDAENLFIILSAKALNPALVVVTRASEEEAGEKLRRAGADTVLTPFAVAGRQLADALLKPHVVEFLDFARTDLSTKVSIEQICVGSQGAFREKTRRELLEIRHAGAIVLAVRREGGETIFNPPSDVRISGGDFLIIMAKKGSLQELEKKLAF
jgi:voltage-gated potassium channel